MQVMTVQGLSNELGWDQKKVQRWAKVGRIPETVIPKSSRGGPGRGYAFKDSPKLREFIRRESDHTLAADVERCRERINTNWQATLFELNQFGAVVPKKLRVLINRRDTSLARITSLRDALLPIVRLGLLLDKEASWRNKIISRKRPRFKFVSECLAFSNATKKAKSPTDIRKSLMEVGRKLV